MAVPGGERMRIFCFRVEKVLCGERVEFFSLHFFLLTNLCRSPFPPARAKAMISHLFLSLFLSLSLSLVLRLFWGAPRGRREGKGRMESGQPPSLAAGERKKNCRRIFSPGFLVEIDGFAEELFRPSLPPPLRPPRTKKAHKEKEGLTSSNR